MSQRVGNLTCLVDAFPFGQEYFNGELVAVGKGEESYLEREDDERRQQNETDAAPNGEPRVTECHVEHLVVGLLHPFGNGVAACFHFSWPDDKHLQERNHRHGKQERHHQVDRYGHGEVLHGVVEGAFHRVKQRIEDDTDAQRGQHHRHEILLGRVDGSPLGLVTFVKILQIAVDDDDGVVDHHSQDDYECRQRDDVELDVHEVHHRNGDESTERNRYGCDDGRPQREQHHHHQNDDSH